MNGIDEKKRANPIISDTSGAMMNYWEHVFEQSKLSRVREGRNIYYYSSGAKSDQGSINSL